MKRCTTCKIHKPVSEFCKNKNSKDGLDYYCHACILVRVKKYQAKNKYISAETAIKIERKCSACQEVKNLLDFYKKKTNKYGFSFVCKVCAERERREDRKQSPLKYKLKIRRSNLRRSFGITIADYDAMLLKQNGMCAICFSPENKSKHNVFHVDHDHATGMIRGLLCNLCNVSLGGFKDSIEALKSAVSYLENNSSKNTQQPLLPASAEDVLRPNE